MEWRNGGTGRRVDKGPRQIAGGHRPIMHFGAVSRASPSGPRAALDTAIWSSGSSRWKIAQQAEKENSVALSIPWPCPSVNSALSEMEKGLRRMPEALALGGSLKKNNEARVVYYAFRPPSIPI